MRAIKLLAPALILLSFTTVSAAALVNINTANSSQLESLPGIGPTKSAAIIDYRTAHGPFAKIEDIQNVKGIGPVTFANMKDQITVGTAPAAAPAQPAPLAEDKQPSPSPASSKEVQQAEPITSVQTNIQENDNGVIAPVAATEVAATGAALSPDPEDVPVAPRSAATLLHSPWLFGLGAVILIAGGAFILL